MLHKFEALLIVARAQVGQRAEDAAGLLQALEALALLVVLELAIRLVDFVDTLQGVGVVEELQVGAEGLDDLTSLTATCLYEVLERGVLNDLVDDVRALGGRHVFKDSQVLIDDLIVEALLWSFQ